MNAIKRTLLAMACAGAMGATVNTAQAANWLMLQGTEESGTAPATHVWGYIQPQYTYTDGTKLPVGTPFAGQTALFNVKEPDLKSNSQFQLQRADIGVRGANFPLDPKVNYFFLAEFGNNGITNVGDLGGGARLLDASVTLNHIPGVRFRFGQFKTPTAEEGLQAIHVFDYVNFTNFTDKMLLERFFDRDGTPACTVAAGGTAETCKNGANGPVAAFRDVGIQLFDSFIVGNWDLSYAAMLGNGNGITRGDNNGSMDTYFYLSSEYLFGGKGARSEGLKLFAWQQNGRRTLITGGTGAQNGIGGVAGTEGEYDRTRSGLGSTFRKSKYRATVEYMKADGMIWEGADAGAIPGALANAGTAYATINMAPIGKADGYYVDVGYLVIPSLELDLRYDVLNRRTDVAASEVQFVTTTVGAQYFFNKKTRMALNYEFRKQEAPNQASSSAANLIGDVIDNRFTLQVTAIY